MQQVTSVLVCFSEKIDKRRLGSAVANMAN